MNKFEKNASIEKERKRKNRNKKFIRDISGA